MTRRDTLQRRSFLRAALGAAAGVGMTSAVVDKASAAEATRLEERTTPFNRPSSAKLYRVEADVRDCEIEGRIPADLNGAFYRVGTDNQYPPHPRNIPFDGEGHVSRNLLLALKEDSPPSALDLLTLETVAANYTFDDQLPGATFTAHPKIARQDQGGRSDLLVLDAEHLEDGPIATVRLPIPAIGQVHGWWVPEEQLPPART
jgi:carotenoid cleavage dioxygenase-like enzyme